MSFRAFWLASWLVKFDALFTSGLVNNAFQKGRFLFGFKIDEILETIVPKKPAKEGQNVVQFNLKGSRIPLLILVTNTVSSIFTNNLKLI
jgi:hypothetical protein